jgi:hypothetical protein
VPRAIDFNRLTITHDPTQRQDLALPTFPPITIEQLLENWQKVLKQFTGIDLSGLDGGLKLFVEFIGGLFNIDFSDLANLPSPEDAWAQIAAKIFSVTGVNIASWPAFLASLDDGAGIDLPVVPRLVAALEGIPWESGDPGAILRAILSAGVQLVRGVIPEWMLPPTNIGRITGELPNLVADGEFLIPPVGESGPPVGAWFRDGAGGRASLVGAGVPSELRVQPVAVAPGQKYQPLAVVSCESATGAAGSVQLVVVEWNDIDLYPTNIRVIASWQPSGTKAAQPITGTYVVPAGVRYAGLGIVTTEGFTGGTLRVHKVDGPSTGLLEMSWTKNLEKRWEQSAKLMGIVDTDLDGDVDLVDVWNTLWAGHLKPLGWVPTVAQDVIDGIYNGFANFGELLNLDRPRTDALDVIYNLLGIGVSNKTSLAALEAEIRLLKSAGNTIAAPFDGAAGWYAVGHVGGVPVVGRRLRGHRV